MVLVAPLVFRAPSDPAVGPGCLVRPWAAARPLAVRAASFARRVVSKPGQAPQAPRRPPIGRGLGRVCLLWPRRRPPAPRLEARPGVAIAHSRPLWALLGLT